MVGIVVCTHSDFATGICHSLEMIAGKQTHLTAVPFDGTSDLQTLSDQIKEALEAAGEASIVAVDLANATPYNAALMAIAYTDHRILSGVSLPMLLELVIGRGMEGADAKTLCAQVMASKDAYVQQIASQDVFSDEV